MSNYLVIMGVSGSGKTAIGRLLSQRKKLPYLEADDAHPPENIQKMSLGQALNDEDRKPWLMNLAKQMNQHSSTGFVVTCSALKQKYRDFLRQNVQQNIQFIFLDGDFDLIKSRMNARKDHFMPVSLLKNQFETLERPQQALTININPSVPEIVDDIIVKLDNMKQQAAIGDLGLIGLGVMGKSLARNFASRGLSVGVYNVPFPGEETVVEEFTKQYANLNFLAADSIGHLVLQLKKPRIVLLMVKSGAPVDELIEKLLPHLEQGDLIIDAGNSYFKDSIRRFRYCQKQDIEFVGMGVSGGEKGALLGPSIMPAGSEAACQRLLPLLKKIAAIADNRPCVNWIGQDGAGHFVKMIHNGIEYADMQLLAETYAIGKRFLTTSNEELATLLHDWMSSRHNSYLLEITIKILQKKEGNIALLEQILDVAGHKGTGLWATKEALDLGVPTPTITAAMNERILSSKKGLREQLSESYPQNTVEIDKTMLKTHFQEAILFARLVALAEGFYLIKEAAKTYDWHFSLSELAQIWRGGCIIRSEMLKTIIQAYEQHPDAPHLFAIPMVQEMLQKLSGSAQKVIGLISQTAVSIPALSAALNYYKSLHTEYLSINMIQAQRDFFGAHTYKKLGDRATSVHTNWEE